jgi:hypothetical protein
MTSVLDGVRGQHHAPDALYPRGNRLGGVVVSVLATGPKVCGFEPGQGDGFLRAIKISSTTSFRMGSKAGGPYRKLLRHLKEFLKSHRDE